jgi:hypothetical protein
MLFDRYIEILDQATSHYGGKAELARRAGVHINTVSSLCAVGWRARNTTLFEQLVTTAQQMVDERPEAPAQPTAPDASPPAE